MSRTVKLPTCLLITENPSIRSFAKTHLYSQFFLIEQIRKLDILDTVCHSILDLILIDGQIENCLALCKEIREALFLNPTPILLITGRLKKSFRDEALDAGVTDFLGEQLDLDEWETRIATAQRALSLREKTADASHAIRSMQPISSSYLKSKILLHDHAVRLLTSSKHKNQATALLIIQIDKTESLRSELGHWAFDALLLSVSEWIHRFLKKDDLLIASSDSRLILLLHNSDMKEAQSFAEHLRKEVGRQIFHTPRGDRWITLSIAYSKLSSETALEKMIDTAIKSLTAQSHVNFIIKLEEPS